LAGGWGCGAVSATDPAVSARQAADLCAGIPEGEAETLRFLAPSTVMGVSPFMGEHRYIKFSEPELRGADIYLRSTPGMTRQWLSRIVQCHAALRGTQGPRDEDDPFVLGLSDVSVLETDIGFVIRLAGRDRHEGAEILRRAQVYLSRRPDAPTN
jgi:hypothetical protein